MATQVLAQGATKDGYSLILFAEGKDSTRRVWWACGGCWSRCKRSADEDAVRRHGTFHVASCSVIR